MHDLCLECGAGHCICQYLKEIKELKEERELLRSVGAFYLKDTTNLRMKLERKN